MRARLYYRKIPVDASTQITELGRIEWSEVVNGKMVPTSTQLKLLKLFEESVVRFNGITGVLKCVTWEWGKSKARIVFEWSERESVSHYRGPLCGWKVFLPKK
jgi:hypothetical protein